MRKGFTLIEMLASRKRGFTLIEMLVTIIIIGIITSVSVVSLRKYKSRSYFNEAVTQIYGEVQKAQSLSIAPRKENVESYTLLLTPDGSYQIFETKEDLSQETIDSGKAKGVLLDGCAPECSVTFKTNGSAESNGQLKISDASVNSDFTPKLITVTSAGSVEITNLPL